MKKINKKDTLKNLKINKEIDFQIMDLADGKLKGEKKDFTEKLVVQNSRAKKLYDAYLKTSMFEIAEDKNGNIKIPKSLRETIKQYEVKSSNKQSLPFLILKKINDYIKNWFNSLFIPKLATVCLIFFVIGQVNFDNIFVEKNIKLRSANNLNYKPYNHEIKIKIENKELQFGRKIPINKEITISLKSATKEKYYLIIENESYELNSGKSFKDFPAVVPKFNDDFTFSIKVGEKNYDYSFEFEKN